MNYYYLLIILLLFLFFIYCQIRVHRKFNVDYQILQVSDPDKNILEKTINNKYPTIITNVIQQWKGIRDLEIDNVKQNSNNIIRNPNFLKLLNQYFNFYHLPLTIYKNYSLKYYSPNDTQYIMRQTYFRFYIAQIYGKSRYILFSPKEEQYLYLSNDKNISLINYWKIENWDKYLEKNINDINVKNKRTIYLDKFPRFNNAKFIEIILHPGNILYIPYNWWFTSIANDENIRITAYSKSLFSW